MAPHSLHLSKPNRLLPDDDKTILRLTSRQETNSIMALLSLNLTLLHSHQLGPLPTADVPRDLWEIVLFLCTRGLALTFTALLVLVEDDSNDARTLGE